MENENIKDMLSAIGIELNEEDLQSFDAIKIKPSAEERNKNIRELINTYDDESWKVLAKKNKFLWKVTNLITADSDMAYKLAVSAGIFLISLATRRQQYIDLKQAKIRFNLFMLIMGFSGKSRKTTTFSMIEEICNRLDEDMLIPEKMTPQALFKELVHQPNALLMRDELSGMFQDLQRDYMRGMTEFLSKLYDNKRRMKEGTISRGKQILENTFFRFYGGTTPTVVKYMKDEQFEQGFMPRFHIVYDNDKNRKRKLLGFESSVFMQNIDDVVTELEKMKNLPTNIFLARDKPQIFEDFELYCYAEADKYLDQEDLLLAAYYERLPIHSLKLAGLFQITDLADLDYQQKECILTDDYIELACKFGRLFEQEYLNLVYRYRSDAPSAPFRTEERRLNKLQNIIKQSGDWIKKSELHDKTKMVKRIFDETLETLDSMEKISEVFVSKAKLVKEGLIEHEKTKTGIRGRLPILIYLHDNIDKEDVLVDFWIKNAKYIDKILLKTYVTKHEKKIRKITKDRIDKILNDE